MNKFSKLNNLFYLLLIVTLILITMFTTLPLALIIARGLKNIEFCLKSQEIISSVKLSFTTSILSTVICLLFSMPVAYVLARYHFPFKKAISALIYLPMSLPNLVSGIALLMIFASTTLGHFLSSLGLDFVFTVKGIVLAQIFINIPYMIKILSSTVEQVEPKLEFIAKTLGCNNWQIFFYITFPLIKNGVIAAIVMTWSRAIGEFGAVLMLAGATRFKTETLPISIFLNISTGDLDLAIATATLLIIISLVSIISFDILCRKEKYRNKNVNY